jgi:hypothetical protein
MTDRARGSRSRRSRKVSIEGMPSEAELAAQPHTHEAADRFSLYTPAQIIEATRPARIEMVFEDPFKIRLQALMAIEAMQKVMALTRDHKLGTIRQRIECRKEVASLAKALSMTAGRRHKP